MYAVVCEWWFGLGAGEGGKLGWLKACEDGLMVDDCEERSTQPVGSCPPYIELSASFVNRCYNGVTCYERNPDLDQSAGFGMLAQKWMPPRPWENLRRRHGYVAAHR